MMKLIASLCVLLAVCNSARAVSYTWQNLSGQSAFGLWDVGTTSYQAGQLAALDSPLTFSFSTPSGQASLNDIFVPGFTLSLDRSLLLVNGSLGSFQAFGPGSPYTSVTFSSAADGVTSWSYGVGQNAQPTFGGTGKWQAGSSDEAASVPDTGSTLLLFALGICFVGAAKYFASRRPGPLLCRTEIRRVNRARSSSRPVLPE